MKRNTPDHPKMKSLAKKLGIPRYAAVGLMESLWHFAADYCPDGGIGRYSDEQLAEMLGWDGSCLELIAALVEARWVEESGEFRLVIHDWSEHADDNVHAKLARSLKTFADGTLPKVSKLNKTEKDNAEAYFKSRIPPAFHGTQKGFHGIPPAFHGTQKGFHGTPPAFHGIPPAPLKGFHGSTALPEPFQSPSLPEPFQSPSLPEPEPEPEPEPVREAPAAPAAPVDSLVSEIATEMRSGHKKKSGLGGMELERTLCLAAADAADPAAVLRSIRDRWRLGCEHEWRTSEMQYWPNLLTWLAKRHYLDPSPVSVEEAAPEPFDNEEIEIHWQEFQRLTKQGMKTAQADEQARHMIFERRRQRAKPQATAVR